MTKEKQVYIQVMTWLEVGQDKTLEHLKKLNEMLDLMRESFINNGAELMWKIMKGKCENEINNY